MNDPYCPPRVISPNAALLPGATYQPKVFASGRVGRVRYMLYSWIVSAVMLPCCIVAAALGGINAVVGVYFVLALPMGGFSLWLAKRRLNDLDRTGWAILLTLIPLVNLFVIGYMLFARGTEGANAYGAAPADNSRGEIVAVWLLPLLMVACIIPLAVMLKQVPAPV